MAEGRRYVCVKCAHTIETWDEGNPYYMDDDGRKQYAYHPDEDLLEQCIGNDSPHLCLSCGYEFIVDSEAPIAACPLCEASKISNTWELEGRPCPYCKAGVFADSGWFAVS